MRHSLATALLTTGLLGACMPTQTCSPDGIVIVCRCGGGAATGTATCSGGKLSECQCTDSAILDGSTADAGDAFTIDGWVMDVGNGPDMGNDLDVGNDVDTGSGDVDGGGGDLDTGVAMDVGTDAFARDTGIDAGHDAGSDAGHDASAVDANADGGAPSAPFPTSWDGRMPTDGVCSPAGWCWVYPRVPDLDYADVTTVPGTGEIWAVGRGFGAIVHYDGTRWTGASHGLDGAIAISAATTNSVWILTSTNGLHRYDGTSWAPTTVPSVPSLRALHAVSPSDVWAVGDLGTVLHWDGATWSVVGAGFSSLSDLRAVHALGPNDVWIGGTGGAIRHFDGATWTDRSVSDDVVTLWAAGPSDVWEGGAALRHWTGTAWSVPPSGGFSNIVTVVGSTPSNVLIQTTLFSYRWNGTTLTRLSDPTGVAAAWDGSRFVVAVRQNTLGDPTLYATDLTSPVAFITRPLGTIDSIFVLGDDDLLVSVGTNLHRGAFDTAFVAQPTLSGHGTPIEAAGIGDVWTRDPTVGYVGHWNGTAWSRYVVSAGSAVTDVARSSSDVWAAAGGAVYRLTGSTWTADPSAPAGTRVLAPSPDGSVFALGNTASAHLVGGSWNVLPAAGGFGFFDASSTTADEVTYVATDYAGRLESGTWTRSPYYWAIYTGAAMGRTAWLMKQDDPTGVPATAYWDGQALYVGPTYVDGQLRHSFMSVVRDSTGRAWAVYHGGSTDVAVVEWRP